MSSLDLGAEMTKDNDGWHFWSNEDGADQQLKVLKPLWVATESAMTLSITR
jgi:hypothetical protein